MEMVKDTKLYYEEDTPLHRQMAKMDIEMWENFQETWLVFSDKILHGVQAYPKTRLYMINEPRSS